MSSQQQQQHDPGEVIDEAYTKYVSGDLESARLTVHAAILDWQDDYCYSFDEDSDSPAKRLLRSNLASLWIGYAGLNAAARQFNSARNVYEEAVRDCPAASRVAAVWVAYAKFCRDRGMAAKAQRVFVQALSSSSSPSGKEGGEGEPPPASLVAEEAERDILWREFWEMMRETAGNGSLTMEDLKAAVEAEVDGGEMSPIADAAGQEGTVVPDVAISGGGEAAAPSEPPQKKAKVEDFPSPPPALLVNPSVLPLPPPVPPPTPPPIPSHIPPLITVAATTTATTATAAVPQRAAAAQLARDIDTESVKLLRISTELPPMTKFAWLGRDGASAPQRPPLLFGPDPPSLKDPAGRDLLGRGSGNATVAVDANLPLRIVRAALGEGGGMLLDVCEGCWCMTVMMEREAHQRLKAFEDKTNNDLKKRDEKHRSQQAVAGALMEAIVQMHEIERNNFLTACIQQRQQLRDTIAWEFRHFLAMQQQILTAARVPGFSGPSADENVIDLQIRICSVVHSAFALRKKIGEREHVALLKGLEATLALEEQDRPLQIPPPSAIPTISDFVGSGTAPSQQPPQQQQQRLSPAPHHGSFGNFSQPPPRHPLAQPGYVAPPPFPPPPTMYPGNGGPGGTAVHMSMPSPALPPPLHQPGTIVGSQGTGGQYPYFANPPPPPPRPPVIAHHHQAMYGQQQKQQVYGLQRQFQGGQQQMQPMGTGGTGGQMLQHMMMAQQQQQR